MTEKNNKKNIRYHKIDHNRFIIFTETLKRQTKIKKISSELMQISKQSGDDLIKNLAAQKLIADLWDLVKKTTEL